MGGPRCDEVQNHGCISSRCCGSCRWFHAMWEVSISSQQTTAPHLIGQSCKMPPNCRLFQSMHVSKDNRLSTRKESDVALSRRLSEGWQNGCRSLVNGRISANGSKKESLPWSSESFVTCITIPLSRVNTAPRPLHLHLAIHSTRGARSLQQSLLSHQGGEHRLQSHVADAQIFG